MNNSFTLIELIIVIAIIAILAAIIAPNAFRAIEKAKVAKAVEDFKTISTASYSLYADTGRWPLQCGGDDCKELEITEIFVDPGWPGWDGPYIESALRKHPWGGQYVIQIWDDIGKGPGADLVLYLDNNCYDHSSLKCEVPENSALMIDSQIDDGSLSTGEFQRRRNWGNGLGYHDYLKVLQWDLADSYTDFINCP